MEFLIGVFVGVICSATTVYVWKKFSEIDDIWNELEKKTDNLETLIEQKDIEINRLKNIIDNK